MTQQQGDIRPLGYYLPDSAVELDPEYDATIIEYYSKSGIDYEPWSPKFNMHFGYFRYGINPFKREAMLDEMNAQVLQQLELNPNKTQQIVDLGCGVGVTTRYCAEHYPNTYITGATIVPWQIDKAKSLTATEYLDSRISFKLINYRHLPFNDESVDGAIAVESSCYDHGLNKSAFLKEAYRVLKPGAKLVVSDGMRMRDKGTRFYEYCYKQVCYGWSLTTFAQVNKFVEEMERLGFVDIQVKNIALNITPSVAYVPWVSIKYLFSTLLSKKGEKDFQKRHFIAPMFGLIVGLHFWQYGYFHVSGRKPS